MAHLSIGGPADRCGTNTGRGADCLVTPRPNSLARDTDPEPPQAAYRERVKHAICNGDLAATASNCSASAL